MPWHRNMVRCQCRVLASSGASVARHGASLRLSPAAGRDDELLAALRTRVAAWSREPGLAGAHLLRTDTPAIAATTEQKIRGSADAVADWILLVCAYDEAALAALLAGELAAAALARCGAADGVRVRQHVLQVAMVPGDPD
jgi:hypothetical protein